MGSCDLLCLMKLSKYDTTQDLISACSLELATLVCCYHHKETLAILLEDRVEEGRSISLTATANHHKVSEAILDHPLAS